MRALLSFTAKHKPGDTCGSAPSISSNPRAEHDVATLGPILDEAGQVVPEREDITAVADSLQTGEAT
jgi:hypothetical protein